MGRNSLSTSLCNNKEILFTAIHRSGQRSRLLDSILIQIRRREGRNVRENETKGLLLLRSGRFPVARKHMLSQWAYTLTIGCHSILAPKMYLLHFWITRYYLRQKISSRIVFLYRTFVIFFCYALFHSLFLPLPLSLSLSFLGTGSNSRCDAIK